MKKPALKIILVLGLCLVLVFSFGAVAQAKTVATPMIAYSVYSSCGTFTHNTTFTVYADKVWEPNGVPVKDVQFEIWTKSNKSDLKMFSGTGQGDDNWRVQISTWQFGNAFGKYHIYAYGVDTLGRRNLIGGVTVTVIPDNIISTATSFYTSVPKNGKFTAYVSGASNNAQDVTGVNFKVYANGLESTEKWYNGQLVKGKWQQTVSIADYQNYHGWYTVIAFTVNSQGAQSYISTIYVKVP